MQRWRESLFVCGAAICGERAVAQTYQLHTFDITHTINLPPQPIFGDMAIRGHFFDHAWMADAMGNGITWEAVPPWTTAPIWPNPQQQPATFNPYGIEFFGVLQDYYDPWDWHDNYSTQPWNAPVQGYTPTSPQPVSNVSGVSVGDTLPIPEAGTQGVWTTQASVPISPPTFASSEIEVQPFTSGSGYLSARIRSRGQWHRDMSQNLAGYNTYAFAWTALDIGRMIQPQSFPPGIPFSWDLVVAGWNLPPAPMWMPPDPNKGRYWDPITFTLTDSSNGQTTTGTLFELYADVSLGGSITGASGSYTLDTQDGGLRVRMDHPFITPRGGVDLEVENGVVVTSRASGCFMSMVLPPVGAVPPFAIQFPTSSFDFVFDPTSEVPGDSYVVFHLGGAGTQEIPEPEEYGAACINGVCKSGVTAAQAAALGGTWQGAGTACPDVPYYIDASRVGFEDISSSGTPSIAGGCDDCGETVPLGFSFSFFGTSSTNVGLSSNGYLAYSGALDTYLNQPIPSTAGPNGVFAGFWDDLDPLAGGDVHYATLGVAPNRRFIAQWTDVPHYGVDVSPHTFQIVLHETTNEIDYRYLDVPIAGGPISPTVGIENPPGLKGLALVLGGIAPDGTRRFVPATGVACPPAWAVSYCTPGTTTNGCTANMSASGVPSVSSTSGFVVTSTDVEGLKQGILFYGINGSAAFPWGAGSTSFLCVKAPYQRSSAQSSGGTIGQCNGAMSLDLLAYLATHPGALGTPFVSGQQCWLQCWFRDPPAPNTTSLSDGLQVTFQP